MLTVQVNDINLASDLNDLLINYRHLGFLPRLIAHNYFFFLETGFNFKLINVLLRNRRGFNAPIGSKFRKLYFSDFNKIMKQNKETGLSFIEEFPDTEALRKSLEFSQEETVEMSFCDKNDIVLTVVNQGVEIKEEEDINPNKNKEDNKDKGNLGDPDKIIHNTVFGDFDGESSENHPFKAFFDLARSRKFKDKVIDKSKSLKPYLVEEVSSMDRIDNKIEKLEEVRNNEKDKCVSDYYRELMDRNVWTKYSLLRDIPNLSDTLRFFKGYLTRRTQSEINSFKIMHSKVNDYRKLKATIDKSISEITKEVWDKSKKGKKENPKLENLRSEAVKSLINFKAGMKFIFEEEFETGMLNREKRYLFNRNNEDIKKLKIIKSDMTKMYTEGLDDRQKGFVSSFEILPDFVISSNEGECKNLEQNIKCRLEKFKIIDKNIENNSLALEERRMIDNYNFKKIEVLHLNNDINLVFNEIMGYPYFKEIKAQERENKLKIIDYYFRRSEIKPLNQKDEEFIKFKKICESITFDMDKLSKDLKSEKVFFEGDENKIKKMRHDLGERIINARKSFMKKYQRKNKEIINFYDLETRKKNREMKENTSSEIRMDAYFNNEKEYHETILKDENTWSEEQKELIPEYEKGLNSFIFNSGIDPAGSVVGGCIDEKDSNDYYKMLPEKVKNCYEEINPILNRVIKTGGLYINMEDSIRICKHLFEIFSDDPELFWITPTQAVGLTNIDLIKKRVNYCPLNFFRDRYKMGKIMNRPKSGRVTDDIPEINLDFKRVEAELDLTKKNKEQHSLSIERILTVVNMAENYEREIRDGDLMDYPKKSSKFKIVHRGRRIENEYTNYNNCKKIRSKIVDKCIIDKFKKADLFHKNKFDPLAELTDVIRDSETLATLTTQSSITPSLFNDYKRIKEYNKKKKDMINEQKENGSTKEEIIEHCNEFDITNNSNSNKKYYLRDSYNFMKLFSACCLLNVRMTHLEYKLFGMKKCQVLYAVKSFKKYVIMLTKELKDYN